VNSFILPLERLDSSYLILISLVLFVITAGITYRVGLLGLILGAVSHMIRSTVHNGFKVWEVLFAWASWPSFLAVVIGAQVLGWCVAGYVPLLTILCALVPLFMGVTACLAYMFIDLERYEVERGYKAVYNPLKGQELALHLVQYGQQVRVPLLIAATLGMIGGFALLNQGLYATIGHDWYAVGDRQGGPGYADFLAYALINLLRVVDVLNLANSHHLIGVAYVRQTAWPASTLLATFRMFFTLVLLQQLFASLRQGRLLSETITDLWSPHQPIHERARGALPQYGPAAIGPLLVSLRSIQSLTREQRDQLPPILAAIGPVTIPVLIRYLRDPHEHIRAIAAATLGRLHANDTVPLLIQLARDSSDMVRQSMVEALGLIGAGGAAPVRTKRFRRRTLRSLGSRHWPLLGRLQRTEPVLAADPIGLALTTLEAALADGAVSVRTKSAQALGRIGSPAAGATPGLIALLKDGDESVRLEAAEALGKIGASTPVTVNALIELLQDASPPVKVSAAQALGALKKAAALAVPALLPLLQDREESVRTAAAEAIGQIGRLNSEATIDLVEGLSSRDSMTRAQTAEALGTIGTTAHQSAPALVEALADRNDHVRAKAVEALGKIGEKAAEVAVPSLVKALGDQDNWVSSLAAEALGQMGESGDEAIPALIRSLRHINPQVRANAAEALGKMGMAAAGSPAALEKACRDEDGVVRSQAIRALSTIGLPTPASAQAVIEGLQDANPNVRATAVETLGSWGQADETVLNTLLTLLEDSNDQVRVQVTKVLPKLGGATPPVIEGLCRRLLVDDSDWVQLHAALALGKLGAAAAGAHASLVHVAQTGEENVREQAMRAMAVILAPESAVAFAAGLKDANGTIRMVASAGLMKTKEIPAEIIPALIDALRDPEMQVRANVAHILGHLDPLPPQAIPLLIECATDPSDGLRINAAVALKTAPRNATGEVMRHLLQDSNIRVRLIAASVIAIEHPDDAQVAAILVEASGDPSMRLRQAVIELIESLGTNGQLFLNLLESRLKMEREPGLRESLTELIENLKDVAPPDSAIAETDQSPALVHAD
jgi:HEAT repeat protein